MVYDVEDLYYMATQKNNDSTLTNLEKIDKLCAECGILFQALQDVRVCLKNGENNSAMEIINTALEPKYNNR